MLPYLRVYGKWSLDYFDASRDQLVRMQGCDAIICMPTTTPDIKVKAVRRLGGTVELVGDSYTETQTHAQARWPPTGCGSRAGLIPRARPNSSFATQRCAPLLCTGTPLHLQGRGAAAELTCNCGCRLWHCVPALRVCMSKPHGHDAGACGSGGSRVRGAL